MPAYRAHRAHQRAASGTPAPGRYQAVQSASSHGGLADRPDTRTVPLALAAVPDPFAVRPGQRVQAKVNRRVDLLEWEHSHGRIDAASYAAGRLVQAAFERAASRPGGSSWREGDRVDAAVAHELAIIRGLEGAQHARAMLQRMERALGMMDARILRAVLGDGLSFAEVAASRGIPGRDGTAYMARRFRDGLETLSGAWAARGRAKA
jgi:hypothetical protein